MMEDKEVSRLNESSLVTYIEIAIGRLVYGLLSDLSAPDYILIIDTALTSMV